MQKRIWARAIYPLCFHDDGKENGDRKGPNNITKWSPCNTIRIPSYNRKITKKFPPELVDVCAMMEEIIGLCGVSSCLFLTEMPFEGSKRSSL